MAWTQTDVANLKAAIAEGVLEVTFADGRRVKYRSLNDMLSTLALIQSEVAPINPPPVRSTLAVHCRD